MLRNVVKEGSVSHVRGRRVITHNAISALIRNIVRSLIKFQVRRSFINVLSDLYPILMYPGRDRNLILQGAVCSRILSITMDLLVSAVRYALRRALDVMNANCSNGLGRVQ